MLEYGWKRLLSAFLALVLVAGMLPAPAFATETEPETQPTVVEETTAESTAPESESVPETTETVTLPVEPTEEETTPETSTEETEVTVPETTEETIAETTEATLPESVQAVQARIDALPTADTVTAEDYDAVQDAYDAYDALTEEEKALIQGAEQFEALFAWFNAQTATLEDNSCGENLTWTLVDGTLTISGTGDMADYYADDVPWNAQCDSITSVVIGEGVTRIGNYAFYGCENLTSVTIPQGVTAIGQSAFTRCSKLNTITIPESVTQIGAYAFRECGLTSVTLPQGITSIGNGTFYNCNKLRTVSIPESVTQIGEFAFYGCALTSVTLPQGITSIAKYTFQYNRNLESVTIPASVTAIGESAFDGCYHIEDVNYGADGLSWWRNIKVEEYNGYLTRATLHTVEEEGILLTGVCGEELTFALTKDGDLTITGTGAMTAYDWNNCAPWHGYVYDGIKSVTISEGVTTVSDNAFEYCYQLATLTLPESLTSIGSRGFFGCSHLGSVSIPASVTEIGDGAFASCGNLAAITVAAGNTAYVAVDNLLYDIGKTTLVQAPGAVAGVVTVPEGVTTIGTYAFSGCQNLTGVTLPKGLETIQGHAFDQCYDLADAAIPDSVTYIGDFAFSGGRSLTDVAIPSGVTYIGENAFISCSGLTSITLPDGLREIGGGAFYNCSGLTGTITIPKSVTTIGNSAFYGCDNLAAFLVIEENESFASQDGILYNAAKTELIQAPCAIAGDVTIPEGVTSIGYSAFNGRSFLTGIALPSTLKEIGSEAFAYCDSLTKITVAEGNEDFASVNGILYNKYKTEFICVPAGISGEITVPEGIMSISSSTFRGCEKITAISLPASVGSIHSSAFGSCTGLESITVAEDNTKYCSVDGILYNKDKTELLCVPAGVTGAITIPDGIPSIEIDTFSGCAKITAITIPTSVTFIDPWSLYDCESLTDIYYLGSGAQWEQLAANIEDYQIHYAKVHTMEAEGVLLTGTCGDDLNYTLTQDYELIITGSGDMKNFEYVNDVPWYDYAEQITSISLPEGLTSISKNAFHMCQNLTSITIPSTVTTIGAYAFEWCWLEETITIPASVSYIGEGAFVGAGSLAVEGDNPYFTADSKGVLYNKDKTELLQAPYLISGAYTIPSTVTKIWPYAFYNCNSITAVTIPDSVTEIGDRAFPYCEGLTSITIPKSVTTIGEGAFYGGGLTKIQVATGNPNYASVNGMLTNKAKTTLLAAPGGLTGTVAVPSGITTIGAGAFSNNSLTGVTLPSSVTTIGDDAFFGCWNLSSITLPSSVTSR